MPDINVPLLRKTLEHITEHRQEWYQGAWAIRTECGTAYCLAGHAVVLSGHEIRVPEGEYQLGYATASGEYVSEVAMEELGLTEWEAERLFAEHNTLPTLWALAEDFTDGEITTPETL